MLTLDDVRARAARFSERWADARYEKGETHSFYDDFFQCFGLDRKNVAVYEKRVRDLPRHRRGFIDLLMPGTLLVEQKSAGLNLRAASTQALDYYSWLPEHEKPSHILTCDFQRWELTDLEAGREWRFTLPELKDRVEHFAFLTGTPSRRQRNQAPVNAPATRLLANLHNTLEAQGYRGHKLQLLLVRLLFILFAEDTGIFQKDAFLCLLEGRTREDGSDLGRWLTELFDTLNTPLDERQETLDANLAEFPYVNGRLFAEPIGTAAFTAATRDSLLDASNFNWGGVSPAIFGALFEGVIDRVTQRETGAHYTPEEAIQRVIGPLFLDDLTARFERIRARRDAGRAKALIDFHDHLAGLRFLDPACGAGNFLVVAYRELRELERLVLKERFLSSGLTRTELDGPVASFTKVNVDQFHGIELDEFPSEITRVALWMTDHIANRRLGEDFGRHFARVPLVTAPSIHHADALEVDWADVLAPGRCAFVLGNPPFIGAKYQDADQRAQVRRVARLGGGGGTLDYVAAWVLKAARYAADGGARVGFVSTNSICQGEQVAQLWPKVWEAGVEIAWGHQTFVWPGRAAVHCVIVGLAPRGREPAAKRLFAYPDPRGEPEETTHPALTAYLFGAADADRHTVVREEARPINGAPRVVIGSKPIDGGHLILDADERAELLAREPEAAPFVRPFVGAQEYLNGGERWILALQDAAPAQLRAMTVVRDRVRRVAAYRRGEINAKGKDGDRKSPGQSSMALARTPTAFHVTVIPDAPFLAIPEVSSERRDYIPLGWLAPPTIPSNKLRLLPDATLWHFGVLTSAMHMAWTKHIGGRLKSDYQYGIGLNYNTFPWLDATPAQRVRVEASAQAVLDARALPRNATSTLADLYDPDTMPIELRRAHQALDAAVDALYRRGGFDDDAERMAHLFVRYQTLVSPTADAARRNARTQRRATRPRPPS